MEKIYVGYVQGTHGLKGELKIKNQFDKPERVFLKGQTIYLNDEEHIIANSKYYKGFYDTVLENLKHINLVEKYIGYDVYIDKDNLNLKNDEYIYADLIGFKIISENKNYGTIKGIQNNGFYDIFEIEYDNNTYYIPNVKDYVEIIDKENREIKCHNIGGLIC